MAAQGGARKSKLKAGQWWKNIIVRYKVIDGKVLECLVEREGPGAGIEVPSVMPASLISALSHLSCFTSDSVPY